MPKLGSWGGGVGKFGQCPKESVFFQWISSLIDDDESCGCDAFEENDDSDDAGGGAGEEQRGRGGEAEKRGA